MITNNPSTFHQAENTRKMLISKEIMKLKERLQMAVYTRQPTRHIEDKIVKLTAKLNK